MITRFRRRTEHGLGSDELFLLLLLVFLATSAGAVRDRTYVPDDLYVMKKQKDAPGSLMRRLRIVYDDDVVIQLGDGKPRHVETMPCGEGFDEALKGAILETLKGAQGPIETIVSPRATTPMCWYLDTQKVLIDLSSSNEHVFQKSIHIEAMPKDSK